jgi:hypothetical protein
LTSLHEALIDAEYDPPEKPDNPWKEGAKTYQTTSNAASNARTMADISNKSTAADQSNRSGFAKIKAYVSSLTNMFVSWHRTHKCAEARGGNFYSIRRLRLGV